MNWVEIFILIIGGVLSLLAVGMPVAFALLFVSIVGIAVTQGIGGPLQQFVLNIQSSVSSFTLLPVPLFILMGEILWQTKIAERALAALDKTSPIANMELAALRTELNKQILAGTYDTPLGKLSFTPEGEINQEQFYVAQIKMEADGSSGQFVFVK